jgi:hypothetical protein
MRLLAASPRKAAWDIRLGAVPFPFLIDYRTLLIVLFVAVLVML